MGKRLLAGVIIVLVSGVAHAQTSVDLGIGGLASQGTGSDRGSSNGQSGVVLYGVIDDGITNVSNFNGQSTFRVDTGISQGSRFGLKGNEYLGGGVSAVFNLESEFWMNNGQQAFPGIIFNRRDFVGLDSNQYGRIFVGRDYDFLFDYITYYTNVAQFAPAYAFHLADDIDRLAGEEVQNAVRYETPLYHGLQAGIMYGFDNGNSASVPHVLSFGIKYSPTGSFNAPYSMSAAYTKTVGGNTSVDGLLGAGATLAQMASGANGIYTAGIAGQVNLGKFGINGLFTYTNQNGIPAANLDKPMVAKVTNVYEVGLQYRMTPAWTMGIGDSWIDQHKSGHYNEASYGIDYRFSARTDVYLFGAWMHAFGNAQNAGMFLATTPSTLNQLPNSIVGMSTTRNQVATQIGIKHVF